MKAIIEGKASFHVSLGLEADDTTEVNVEILGHPDEDLDHGMILLSHPKVSLELSLSELQSALRMFERRGYERR